MKENIYFYKCPICGKMLDLSEEHSIICCGKEMERLSANIVDASTEKHVPVYERVDDEIVVHVGEVEHPMEKEHSIMWIYQVTENRVTRVRLYPEQSTETRFPYLPNSTLYAYCNLHGLWKSIVQ